MNQKSKNEVLVRGATLNSLAIDLVGVPKHARTQLGRYRRVWWLAGISCRPTTVIGTLNDNTVQLDQRYLALHNAMTTLRL